MMNDEDKLKGAIRVSWCHLTERTLPIDDIFKNKEYHVMDYKEEISKIIIEKNILNLFILLENKILIQYFNTVCFLETD